jgi:hypothetical protein
MLVHMQPHEVAGLQSIARAQGGSLTVNPDTGLVEAFKLGDFFKSMLPTLAGAGVAMIPGMQPYALQAGIAAGAATGALTNKENPFLGAVTGGFGGFGGQQLAGNALAGAGEMAKAGVEPSIGSVQSGFNAIPTNLGVNMSTPNASIMGSTGERGVNMGATNLAKPITSGPSTTGMGSYNPALETPLSQSISHLGDQTASSNLLSDTAKGFGSNVQQAYSNVAADPMNFMKQNAMGLGLPVVGGIMAGIEPSDIYGKQSPMTSEDEEYDPRATQNFNFDTGLRLYADGGTVTGGGLADLYSGSDNVNQPNLSANGYGLGRLSNLANQQSNEQARVLGYAKGGYLDGPGDGMSDSIPATIEGRQPARLADGEFVIPADVVSHLGNGSTKAGSQRLYGMLDKVRKARTGTKKQGKQINPNKYMPA